MTRAGRPILVTAPSGQVGYELTRALAALAPVCGLDRASLDITDADAVRTAIRELNTIAVVNAAAYTAVDRAEDEAEIAAAANAVAPAVMAEEAARIGACFVHYSTDYVFDGAATRPYREDDVTAPLNVYGRTKLAGEQAVMAVGGANLVLRCSWVYGTRGRNFLLTMQRLAQEREVLRVVADQHGCPTWARFIANATAAMLGRVELDAARLRERAGLYHLSSSGRTSWHGFASAILAARIAAGANRVEAIDSTEYPVPARRPAYSVLDCSKLAASFGLAMPAWNDQLGEALAQQSGAYE